MKRFGQIEIITAVIIIVTSLAGPAGAAITWSGDVDPSDPSSWDSSTTAYIGNTGYGTMGITGGSDVIDYVGYIGYMSGSTGAVTVDGAGSTWINNYLYVGVHGGGTLNITGGEVSNREGIIGYDSDSTGEVTVDGAGSTWTNSDSLRIGYKGDGTLNITGGGVVSNGGYSYVGQWSDSTGEVTVDGANSTWTNRRDLTVGSHGNGRLSITGGGAVSNKYGYIGQWSDSTGEVTVDGANSTWTNNYDLYVGYYEGNGTLNITGGGDVKNISGVIGDYPGSTGEVTVDGANSTWTNRRDLTVGRSDNGTLNITDGGLVSVARTLTIDKNGDGDSFINMATGGMLAILGDADDSLVEFMGIIEGTDAIRYWDSSIGGWADITGATLGIDYTLEYLTEGDLAGYTMLTVPEPTIPVTIDIKPGSCPNPLRVNFVGQGVIKVAIVGSEDFDVLDVDVATITLEGVAPTRSSYKDVSTFGAEACECTTLGQDGFLDLELKFDRSSLLEALEASVGDLSAIGHRTLLPLTLEGMLYEEIADVELLGSDCVAIRNRGAIKRRK